MPRGTSQDPTGDFSFCDLILGTEMRSFSCSYASFSPPNVYLAWMTSIDCIEHECGMFFFLLPSSVSCSAVSNSATPWTVAYQAPLSMGIHRARILA